jgi:hypothetical protein
MSKLLIKIRELESRELKPQEGWHAVKQIKGVFVDKKGKTLAQWIFDREIRMRKEGL